MKTIFKRTLTAFLALMMVAGVVFGTVSCADPDASGGESKTETTAGTTAGTTASTESTSSTETAAPGETSAETAAPGETTGESTSSDTTTPGTSATDTSAPVESESTERNAYDKIEKEDFGGKVFTICNREECKEDLEVEELTNDTLDDMIYERNAKIASDFGIRFEYVTKGDYNEVNVELQNQATSNTDDFDIFIGHKFSFASCVQNNFCYNLNNIDTLDLTQEYWDQACYENLTIDDKTYAMTGDIFPTSMRASSCIVFNKVLMNDLQKSVDDLNTLTQEDKWTLDTLIEYTADVTQDKNGDSTITYEEDQYGLVSWMMDVPFSFYYGAGKPFVSIVDGTPELTHEDSTEQILNIYEKIFKVIVDQQAYFITDVNYYETCYDVFVDGRALFCDITLSKINSMIVQKNMKEEYGILPVPKYDEAQVEYLSFVNGAIPFVMIGAAEKDAEFVGTILEAMSAYNYDNVTPKMFEIVTKLQAAQDPISSGMVDLIIRNRIFDLAYFFDWDISNLVINGLKEQNPSIASKIKSSTQQTSKRVLPKLIEAYEKCD